MSIRSGGVGYFFYRFGFNFAADILLQFFNINKLSARRLTKQLGSDLFLQEVVLLKLGKNDVKLVGRHGVVIQSLDNNLLTVSRLAAASVVIS